MTTDDRIMEAFRARLQQLIDDRFEGKYSRLARRAGMSVSSLQHILHTAKHFPSGDLLLRLAGATEVTVDYLLAGRT